MNLNQILTLRRPAKSATENRFVNDLRQQLKGSKFDPFGNLWMVVEGDDTTLFSCHTDTVSAKDGVQQIHHANGIVSLYQPKPGQSLGADDGAGIYLMLQMIEHSVPGTYVFHREEEIGGLGSRYVARHHPDWLEQFERAIAFDRKGKTSIITHQLGGRCCSDEFAAAFANQLGLFHYPDRTGLFTDTAHYTHLIPECTNISVGYENEHGPRETLDMNYLELLLGKLLSCNFSALPTHQPLIQTQLFDDDLATYFSNKGMTGKDLEMMLDTQSL